MDTKDFKFATSKNEKDLTTLVATISKETYEKELEKQVEIYRPRVNIRGFRIGHAPNSIILAHYREALEGATDEAIIEETWNKFQEENNVKALSVPKLSNIEKKDGDVALTYEYYQMPDFDLPELPSISVEKDKFTVDDNTIENGYKLYIKKFSQFAESERKSEVGDKVTVSLEFSEDKNKKYNHELTVIATEDENESIFARNALGVKKEDKKLLQTFINDDEATFIMNILKVEKPDMKDDSTEEDRNKLKESLKEHFAKRAEEIANSTLLNKTLFEKIVSMVKVDIPKGYFEEQIENAIKDLEDSLNRKQTNMTDYLLAIAKKKSDVEKEYEETVRKQIIFDLIMAKLAETYKDSITINEDKAQEYAQRMYQYQTYMGISKRPKDEQQTIVKNIMREAQNRAMSEAILEYVKEHIQVTEKTPVKFIADDQDIWLGY